jgi:hypothetical protein
MRIRLSKGIAVHHSARYIPFRRLASAGVLAFPFPYPGYKFAEEIWKKRFNKVKDVVSVLCPACFLPRNPA